MRMMHENARQSRGYSLEDAADFLEYDCQAIEYWLRMGHLDGEWDAHRSGWRIKPQALIDFLRQSREPMPTGSLHRQRTSTGHRATVTADAAGD